MGLIRMYIENMMLYMIAALPLYVIGRMVFIKMKKKSVEIMREIILAGFTLYLVGLASQTVIPNWSAGILTDTGKFYFSFHMANEFARVNLIPFNTLFHYFTPTNELVDDWGSVSVVNLAGNVFMFSPIGFFVSYLWEKWRTFRRMLLVGLGTTCFIEISQYFIGRSSDIDDVILNTCGVLIGYGVFVFVKGIRRNG